MILFEKKQGGLPNLTRRASFEGGSRPLQFRFGVYPSSATGALSTPESRAASVPCSGLASKRLPRRAAVRQEVPYPSSCPELSSFRILYFVEGTSK